MAQAVVLLNRLHPPSLYAKLPKSLIGHGNSISSEAIDKADHMGMIG
jgi:hypothetical protein